MYTHGVSTEGDVYRDRSATVAVQLQLTTINPYTYKSCGLPIVCMIKGFLYSLEKVAVSCLLCLANLLQCVEKLLSPTL